MGDFDMNELVEKTYVMNPETEDVLPTGEQLRNGMIVLIESRGSKVGLENTTAPVNLTNARKQNRWCEVSELRIWPDSQITFIGIYADGVKCQRRAPVRDAWIVKIDSVPDAVTSDTEPLYVKEGIDKLATISDAINEGNRFNEWYDKDAAWCSTFPGLTDLAKNNLAYVPLRSERFSQKPKYGYIYPDSEPKAPPEPISWHDLDVGEQDDLHRWSHHIKRNENGYIDLSPMYVLELTTTGRRLGMNDLKNLFPTEFGLVEEKKVAVKAQDRTASADEISQRFTDAEKDELIGIHQVTEGQLDDDGEIILKSGAKISGWEFKKLFE